MSQFVPDGLNVFFLKKNHILQNLIYLVLHLLMNHFFVKSSRPPVFCPSFVHLGPRTKATKESSSGICFQEFWLGFAFMVSSPAGVCVSGVPRVSLLKLIFLVR